MAYKNVHSPRLKEAFLRDGFDQGGGEWTHTSAESLQSLTSTSRRTFRIEAIEIVQYYPRFVALPSLPEDWE